MKKIRILSVICAAVVAVSAFFQSGVRVEAATTSVIFETDSYEINKGDEITVSVYLTSDTNIGAYHAEVSYDSYRLEYTGGGDNLSDGKIILEGTGYGSNTVYKLTFRAISGGMARITCSGAEVRIEGTDTKQQLALNNNLSINIIGEDTAVTEENQEIYGLDSDVPLCGVVDSADGKKYYIVDHYRYVPDAAQWEYQLIEDSYNGGRYTFLTNNDKNIRILYLMDKDENFVMYAYSKEKKALYPCKYMESDGKVYYVMSANVSDDWADGLSLDYVKKENICYAMTTDGTCAFYKYNEGELILWDEEEGAAFFDEQMSIYIYILAGAFGVVVIAAVVIGVGSHRKKLKQNEGKEQQQEDEDENGNEKGTVASDFDIEFINTADDSDSVSDTIQSIRNMCNVSETEKTERPWEHKEKPVIAIKDVTMRFKISVSNASGIKEYIIQKVKGQAKTRDFTALNHVSMNVYKGEVLGIIGTNGSGKSTLLKIISGALAPTSGKVKVDRKKVQLLTLGTGFDMELTARENVYLSGAIIGYTKEFIDENFDKIIEFAELQDFVDEKVKNFSSGMVSRLGFSIATIGAAAEILILDEVLSVGDAFFRKKSLKRINEMIHGGSTVIMVAHGTGTILDNCTKVAWLEKGNLKMIGNPKYVCNAYKKYER